ncbi:MAG: immunoglobulin domain-containing protein, partial [Candidatus Didemnitutus sp.]|nr:immunoglobulin domain-containing protein [Candidatus Didemnitutus sp.]
NADYSLYTTFTPPAIDNFVHALARATDGTIYVGGEFTTVNGHAYPGLFRFSPNGSLDLSWSPRDNPPLAAVTALAIAADGKLLVGRQNTFSGGQASLTGTNVLRRLNADGTHDTSFSVDITTNNNRLYAIVAEPSGSVAFSGLFSAVNGVTRHSIARVSNTGASDPLFGGSSGAPANNTVFGLTRLADGRYLVAGTFTTLGGVTRNRVALLNLDGTVDPNFAPVALNGNALGAAMNAAGEIFVGGTFNTAEGTASYGLVKLSNTGAVLTRYTDGGVVSSFATTTASRPLFIYPQADGSIALFGSFQAAFNQRRVGLAVVGANGALASSPSALLYRPAFTGSAFEVNGNRTLVFGSIDSAAGAAGQLGQSILLHDNGSIDPAFPAGSGFALNGLSTFGIYRAMRQSDGKFIAVGDLAGYNGNAGNRLLRVGADGAFDAGFNAGTGPSLVFPQILSISGGRTLLFSNATNLSYNGTSFSGMVRLNADGTRDTTFVTRTFVPASSGLLAAYEDNQGRYVVVGTFTSYDGVGAPGIMRLNPDGSRDHSFSVGNVSGGIITVISGLPDGRLIAAGSFTSFNGVSVNRLVLLQEDGQLAPNFSADSAINAPVGQVLVQEDGKLILIGDFTGTPSNYAARLNPSGSLDSSFALHGLTGGGGGGVRVFVAEDGSVYAHNMLASFNNGGPVAVARFRGVATAPSIAVAPQGGALEEGKPSAMFVQAAGTGPFTYQWRLNGNAIDGATNSILRFPGPTSADSGSYSVAITGPGGVTLSNPVTVTVGTLPVITDQPFGRTTVAGGKVLFRATASGTPTLTYQWRKNGVPIVGATNSDLTLSPVSAADAGSYSVAVTNAIGVALSTAVSLQVIAPDNVLWQQFTETSTEFSPARSFHDGLGKVYLPWSIQDRNPDMGAGKLVGALARYSESTGAYDPTFKLDRRYRSVSHMERQADGKLILAVGAGDAHTVIRVDSTGAVDSTFVAPQFMRSIRFVSLQADGRVLVAATDNLRANTVPDALATGSPAIYRLNANGSIDTSFNVTLLSATGVLFGPPRTDASGRIYLVGSFASVNGVTRANVARLNFDGSLEPNFGANLPTGFGSNQARGVEFQNDGRVIVVGDFRYTARGTSGDPIQAIRFNTDGTFDTTFAQPLRSQLGFNPALGTRARYLVPVGNDKMVVVSDRLVRLNADGTRDTSFTSPAFERESFWVSQDSSGNLYVDDQSGVMGAAGLFLPIWDNGVVRFDSNGQPTFAFQTGGFGRAAYPTSARVTSDGNVWLGGSFNRFGASVAPGLARFSSPTTLAANQPAAPSGSPDNFRNSPVTSVTSGSGDLTYVISVLGTNSTGTFYSALQRLNSAGGVDSSFNPVLPSGYNLGTAAPRSGPAGKLMLAQGTVAAAVALNGGAGDSLLRLNVDGTRDSSYIPDLASFAVVERNPVTNAVTMIRTGGLNVAHVNSDGSALLVVSSVDGNLRLVRLLTNGAVDGSFNAPSFGSITPSSGFTSVGTFDPVTNTTGQFPISTYSASDLIRTAVQMPNGKIYVGGRFNLSGSPRGLIRLNADGSLDSSFVGVGIATSAVDAGPYVASLAVDTSGRLHVAGRFTSYNGLSTNGLFRLRADGSFDAAWNPGFGVLDRPVASANLIVAADKLYVFGTGGLTNDALPSAYKFVDIPAAPVFNVQPAVYTGALLEGSTMFVSGTATGPGTLTYQWFRDGVSIPGATNSSYSALAAAGSYTLVVTSEYGSQTSSPAIITITPTSPVFNAAGNNISGTFGQVVPVGTAALLTATPTAGTTPISYQWLFNGVEIPGATSQTYFLSSWSASDAGDYSVRATNSLGTSTSPSDRFLVSHEGGLKWANPMPTGNGLTRGEFLNGQFFVGGLRGTLLVSSDGLNWVQRHVPASNNIFKVQRIGALYVAMASLNAFFTSPDGVTWTPRSTGVDGGLTSFQDMTAGGGRIVAVGTGGVTG